MGEATVLPTDNYNGKPGHAGVENAQAAQINWLTQAWAGRASDPALAGAARNPRIHHLDVFDKFFAGGKWITGQGNTATTASSAVNQGLSVIPVASAAGLSTGVQLVIAEGTVNQRIYTVQSVAGSDVTIVGTTGAAIANGATITPLWTNSSHLTAAGYRALARFFANAKTATGDYVLQGTAPKVVILGNSWGTGTPAVYAEEIQKRIPGATVVNVSVAGNKSADLLARFAADVPADADYVIPFEPSVNDDISAITPSVQAENFQKLVAAIFAIGATPVYPGHIPLADALVYSTNRNARVIALMGTDGALGYAGTPDVGSVYSPEADSVSVGGGLLKVTTGSSNTTFGARAGAAVTTGFSNSLFGREAGTGITTGNNNTGVGQNSLRALTTGSTNTAIGQAALASLATGSSVTAVGANAGLSNLASSNVFVGKDAGQAPGGDSSKATTTGTRQTHVGTQSGVGFATQADDTTTHGYQALANYYSATAVGSGAKADGHDATAVGKGALAGNHGAAAFGVDSGGAGATATANNECAIGTANHTVRLRGHLQVDRAQTTVGAAGAASALPAAPSKYLLIKDSTGTSYAVPAYAAA